MSVREILNTNVGDPDYGKILLSYIPSGVTNVPVSSAFEYVENINVQVVNNQLTIIIPHSSISFNGLNNSLSYYTGNGRATVTVFVNITGLGLDFATVNYTDPPPVLFCQPQVIDNWGIQIYQPQDPPQIPNDVVYGSLEKVNIPFYLSSQGSTYNCSYSVTFDFDVTSASQAEPQLRLGGYFSPQYDSNGSLYSGGFINASNVQGTLNTIVTVSYSLT